MCMRVCATVHPLNTHTHIQFGALTEKRTQARTKGREEEEEEANELTNATTNSIVDWRRLMGAPI